MLLLYYHIPPYGYCITSYDTIHNYHYVAIVHDGLLANMHRTRDSMYREGVNILKAL